jgi:hypothetical protein
MSSCSSETKLIATCATRAAYQGASCYSGARNSFVVLRRMRRNGVGSSKPPHRINGVLLNPSMDSPEHDQGHLFFPVREVMIEAGFS